MTKLNKKYHFLEHNTCTNKISDANIAKQAFVNLLEMKCLYIFFQLLDFGGWLVEFELGVNAMQKKKKKKKPHKQDISQG